MICDWKDSDPLSLFQCKRCGRTVPRADVPVLPYRRACIGPRGLGDWIAGALLRLGILKRPGCGCARRQSALNRLFPFSVAVWRLRLSLVWRLFRSAQPKTRMQIRSEDDGHACP